jgi:hypothetical protein
LLEPAPADRVIRACVAGFAACRVAIKAPGHAYADVWPGRPDVLASCGCGSAKILWCQDAGGAPYDDNAYGTAVDNNGALAYVRTGLEAGRGRACMAPAGGIPGAATTGISPGSAACDMYNWDSAHGQWIAAGYKEVVFNNGSGPTSAAKIINVVYLSGSPFAVVDQC